MRLTVMTMNLLCPGAVNPAGTWAERLPLVLEVLQSGADVVALQEATTGQLADIAHALPEFAVVSGPESGEARPAAAALARVGRLLRGVASRRRRLPPPPPSLAAPGTAAAHPTPPHPPHHPHGHHYAAHYRGEHCAILYRRDRFEVVAGDAFWLSHHPDVSGSVLPGTWLPRVVNWVCLRERAASGAKDVPAVLPAPEDPDACRLATLSVYNAHLDFLPWSPLRSARILGRVLDRHWDGHTPQVLMGDFNAVPNSAAFRHFAGELKRDFHPALTDAWLAAEERVGPEGTFHAGTGRVRRWVGRLDRILFRPSLRVARAATITHHHGSRYPSDHFPVMAELDYAPEAGKV